jgi:CspA family cold shock protein
MSFSETNPDSSTAEIMTGRVKWFNNKSGYGFITVNDGSCACSDIFVHHSAVQVLNQQYKYLVQGEYVEFSLINTPNGTHDVQAANVRGIKGGQLMCETRREFRMERSSYKTPDNENRNNHDNVEVTMRVPRSVKVSRDNEAKMQRVSGSGPPRDEDEWKVVKPSRVVSSGGRGGRGASGRSASSGGRGRGRGRLTRTTTEE